MADEEKHELAIPDEKPKLPKGSLAIPDAAGGNVPMNKLQNEDAFGTIPWWLVYERLDDARELVIERDMYLAHAICSMNNPMFTTSKSMPTAGVALNRFGQLQFFFNPWFLLSLTVEELAFVLAHEASHVAGCHMLADDKENKILWNICCDIFVNTWLQQGKPFDLRPETKKQLWFASDIGMDERQLLRYLDADMLYNELHKDVKRKAEVMRKAMEKGFGTGEDGNGGTMDQHEGWDEISDPVLEELARQLAKEGFGKDGSHISGKDAGKSPAGLKRLFETIKESFAWEKYLKRFIGSIVKRHETWERPNRRITAMGFDAMLPAEEIRFDHKIRVYGDMSGSINKDTVSRFVSLLSQVPSEVQIESFTFDTRIYPWNLKGEPQGGGGTDFQAVVNHSESLGPVDAVIVLTDGYCGEPHVKHPKQWLWLTIAAELSPRSGTWMKIPQKQPIR